jgi:hypothetical protein
MVSETYPDQTLPIYLAKTHAVEFGLDAAIKKELMERGREAAILFSKRVRRPVRRYSVG